MNPDFTQYEKLLVALARADVAFMTVGGLAVSFNGFIRTTEDVDILVAPDPENLNRLLRALLTFGEGSARDLSSADFTDEEGCIRIIEEFPLDVFTRMGGLHYADLLPYLRQADLDDVKIPYLGSEGLILLKQESVREKDRIDVLALKKLLAEASSRNP